MVRHLLLANGLPACLIGFLACLALTTISPPALPAQVDNLEQIRRGASQLVAPLLERYSPGDSLCLRVADHPASWVLEQSALERAEARSLAIYRCQAPAPTGLLLALTEISVFYRLLDDTDSTERRTRVAISASLPGEIADAGRQAPLVSRSHSLELVDTVGTDRLRWLEGSGYDFARGTSIATHTPGFWERIVEPAVILAASAVMVILLFTVRSQ